MKDIQPEHSETSTSELFGVDPYVRLKFVMQATGLSRSSIYKFVSEGTFPKQTHLGLRAAAWRLSEVENWMKQREVKVDKQVLKNTKSAP